MFSIRVSVCLFKIVISFLGSKGRCSTFLVFAEKFWSKLVGIRKKRFSSRSFSLVICFFFRATLSLLCWRTKENHSRLMISSSAVPFKPALIHAFRAALHCFFLRRKCCKALFGLGSLLDWEIALAYFSRFVLDVPSGSGLTDFSPFVISIYLSSIHS